jgi:hypothetical protein
MTLKEQAVKTASERLQRLEDWTRRLVYLMVAVSAMTAVTAGICVFGAWKYWQVTSAIANYGDYASNVMNDPEVRSSRARADAARAKLQETINSR